MSKHVKKFFKIIWCWLKKLIYQHQNKKQNLVSSGIIILQIPFTNFVPTPHFVSIVSSAIGSGVYSISGICLTINFSLMICFWFSSVIVCSTLWDFIITEDTSTWWDTMASKVVSCCSDVYPVSPVYFLIIDLSWM